MTFSDLFLAMPLMMISKYKGLHWYLNAFLTKKPTDNVSRFVPLILSQKKIYGFTYYYSYRCSKLYIVFLIKLPSNLTIQRDLPTSKNLTADFVDNLSNNIGKLAVFARDRAI